jgi:hypothetical protein
MMPGLSGYAEEQLGTFLQNLEKSPLGWQAVHLHFSKLRPQHQRQSTLRIALNAMQDLIANFHGKIFVLFNNDVVVLVRGIPVADVKRAVEQARGLFQNDPAAGRPGAFSTWYDLSLNFNALRRVTRDLLIEKSRLREAEDKPEEDTFVRIEPLDPGRLDQAQAAISSLDISSYMRRQPICAMTSDDDPHQVFEEIYVRIADLQKPLMPNVNLAGNRWLFQHLTQSLDLRVLATLTYRPGGYLNGPVSLNMNIDTVLSESFLAFDNSLRAGTQKKIIIEIQPVDLFADYKSFQIGREFLRSRGYRMCIDGLTPDTLALCDRRRIGADLVKVHWADTLSDPEEEAARETFATAVADSDPKRVILSRCDTPQAVNIGSGLGIGLFQGRYVDEMLRPGTYGRN